MHLGFIERTVHPTSQREGWQASTRHSREVGDLQSASNGAIQDLLEYLAEDSTRT